jgi:hypothetical protein
MQTRKRARELVKPTPPTTRALNSLEMRRILAFVDPINWFTVACVNKSFLREVRELYKLLASGIERADLRNVWFALAEDRGFNFVLELRNAVDRRHYHSLRKLRARFESTQKCKTSYEYSTQRHDERLGSQSFSEWAFQRACLRGDVRVLRVLDEEFFSWSSLSYREIKFGFLEAVRREHIAVMWWIINRFGYTYDRHPDRFPAEIRDIYLSGFNVAAQEGSMVALQWLYDLFGPMFIEGEFSEDDWSDVCLAAAENGRLNVLIWMERMFRPMFNEDHGFFVRELFSMACVENHVEVLRWLVERYTLPTMMNEKLDLHVVDGMFWQTIAGNSGRAVESLQWIVETFNVPLLVGTTKTRACILMALGWIKQGRIDLLVWLVSRCGGRAFTAAELREDPFDGTLYWPLCDAAASGNVDMVRWLVEHCAGFERRDAFGRYDDDGMMACVFWWFRVDEQIVEKWKALGDWLADKFAITHDDVCAHNHYIFQTWSMLQYTRMIEWLMRRYELTIDDVRISRDQASDERRSVSELLWRYFRME